MRSSIHKDTGHWVPVDELWQKLRSCYNIDALDAIELEYEIALSNKISLQSPSIDGQNIKHPYIRGEFSLPSEPSLDPLISTRRVNPIASPPSSPETAATSPAALKVKLSRSRKKNAKSKASMAGLVGGESDSSDLTDSGEEGQAPSVVTATDGGETVDGEADDDIEIRDATPDTAAAKTGRRKSTTKKAATTRVRASTTGSSTRPAKKRKR
ncbi:Chromatin modification-related protein EAF7 [Lentinula edodes]|uniref:Chromatin modification-related protein EAF7 n=2 Tax=Lentinula TaxID=5352 RepID=A0A1Q3DY78_LENED|nr:Chromatin modification-related protein EAF7 [Lentinula edodes]